MITAPRKMAPGERLTAANYNALLDYVKRITPLAGANVKVDYRLGGAIISGTPGGDVADRTVKPFAVRHHAGQWEIYMPVWCVNVGGTCAPINPTATTGGNAHADDPDGWRVLYLDESNGTTGTDGDGNSYREWNVAVHAKTSAKMYGVDALDAPARRLVWAGVTDSLKTSGQMTDAERYKDTPGDAFSCDVAHIRVTTVSNDGEPETARSVTQLRETPVDVGDVQAPIGFDLVWYFSVDDGELKVENVYCVRQLASLAGISATGDTMTDVKGAEWVYAKIETADMTSGNGIVDVVSDPGIDVYSSTDTVMWLALFRMNNDTVVEDYRENSLKNVQVYRA